MEGVSAREPGVHGRHSGEGRVGRHGKGGSNADEIACTLVGGDMIMMDARRKAGQARCQMLGG